MPEFSAASKQKLERVHPELRRLFDTAVKFYDCQILQGERTVEQQRANVESGVSETMDSKHLIANGREYVEAVDVAPYPVIWPNKNHPGYNKELSRFYHFGGFIEGLAKGMKIPLRWGGDWDSDHDFADQTFDDLVHFELRHITGPF